MIENLNGLHEIVNYKENTNLRLYSNTQAEDYPNHCHTPLEIIMPLENTYSVEVNQKEIVLKPYDIILINPGVIHALKAPSEGRRIIFQAEITMLSPIRSLGTIISHISPALKITEDSLPEIHRQTSCLLLQIQAEYNNNSLLSETAVYSKLLEMFVLIGNNLADNFEQLCSSAHVHKEYSEKFLFICNYINEHCFEDLNLDDIAKLAGFSKYHFTRLFKRFTATTFYQYLNQKRIEHARRLLADPDISVTDAALSSGYTSLSSFIRMFKQVNGCTPSEYRRMFTGRLSDSVSLPDS